MRQRKSHFSFSLNRPPKTLHALSNAYDYGILLGPGWMGALGLAAVSLGEQVALDGSQSIFSRCELWLQLQG